MALAAVLVPAYRVLRSWLDQRMFAERHERVERFEQLRAELAACRGAEERVTRAGVRGRAEVIARIDAETLVREAQAMQSALRRYVPGAVAERLLAGDALESAEREVSVLFVDIRDYTRLTAPVADASSAPRSRSTRPCASAPAY